MTSSAKEVVKNLGWDFTSIAGFIISMLPVVQTVIGVVIAVVILLINIERYRKIKKDNYDETEKEEKISE